MDKSYKYFIGVVQAGSVSKAAQALRISQPALSHSLKLLEKTLRTDLLVRSKKGISLTPEGKVVYENAIAIQDIEKNIHSRVKPSKNSRLRIGAIDSVARQIVKNLNSKNLSQLIVDNTAHLTKLVADGKLDLAYVVKPQQTLDSLDYSHVAEESMVLVGNSNEKPIPFLAYSQESNTYKIVKQKLKEYDIKTKEVLYSTDPQVLIEFAKLNRGIAVVPKSLVDETAHSISYRDIRISRTVVQISRKKGQISSKAISLSHQVSKSLK